MEYEYFCHSCGLVIREDEVIEHAEEGHIITLEEQSDVQNLLTISKVAERIN